MPRVDRVAIGSFILLAAILIPGQAAAQEEGCPWCVKPSECGLVEENTPHGGCEDESGTCEPEAGACVIGTLLLPELREGTLDAAGIEYRGTFIADIEGGHMTVIGVDDGLFARWGCSGELTDIFRRDATGAWVALDVKSFGDRFTLPLPNTP